MDPIAHTLAGATMAQTGLKRTTPLATATLIIGANIPDIDAILIFAGSDDATFLYRRGLTHGVGALVVLPLLLTAVMVAYDRWFRRRRDPSKPPIKLPIIYGLGVLGVISHMVLDWLNVYGIRLLMPFDDRWFYGDILYILDPWMWLLLAATVVFAHSQTRLSQAGWIALGAVLSAIITIAPQVPMPATILWWCGIAVIVGRRWRGVRPTTNRRMATWCLVAVCVYLAATMVLNQIARNAVIEQTPITTAESVEMMTGPIPANPFVREVIAETDTHYYGYSVDLLAGAQLEEFFEPVAIEPPDEIVASALADDSVEGFTNWMRFPTWEVREIEDGHRVIIRDLRYVNPDEEDADFGMVSVEIPKP